ncbi:MAG: hypothetical protein Q9192_006368 [Flavoplaca navasiana]
MDPKVRKKLLTWIENGTDLDWENQELRLKLLGLSLDRRLSVLSGQKLALKGIVAAFDLAEDQTSEHPAAPPDVAKDQISKHSASPPGQAEDQAPETPTRRRKRPQRNPVPRIVHL